MKKYSKILLVLFIALIVFFGCSDDYDDGKAFFRVTASDPIDPDYTYFPFLPEYAVINTFYEVEPGTYNVAYSTIYDEAYYIATIIIDVNEATKKADGEDKHFTFHIYTGGSYNYTYYAPSNNGKTKNLPEGCTFENKPTVINPVGEPIDSFSYEEVSGKYKMTVNVDVYYK